MPEGFKPRTPNLPPAGEAQREELKRRQDALDEQAETLAATVDQGVIDADALKLERELMERMDSTTVTNPDPNYHYCWANFQSQHGWAVKAKLAFRGWQVVTGEMKEAEECKTVDGTRKLGDTLLMRLPKDRKKILDLLEQEDRNKFNQSPTANLQQLADKYRDTGVIVRVNDRADLGKMESRYRGAKAAQERFDQALRDGTLKL